MYDPNSAAFFSKSSLYILASIGDTGDPIASPSSCELSSPSNVKWLAFRQIPIPPIILITSLPQIVTLYPSLRLQAFDSLWSETDDIFKYIANIRTILDGAEVTPGEILPSDPPSYENSMSERFIEYLKQNVSCLEKQNEKRKAFLGEFSITSKSDDFDEVKQEKPTEDVSDRLRYNALKSLESYTRARHAALKTNLDLLEQISKNLSRFRCEIGGRNPAKDDSFSNWYDYEETVRRVVVCCFSIM
ncbi:unnamed protein product [Calicophoron daubneyi]|uniref:Uncharacterized protein n=1 Tax=Calicophoron daubneyi TaxID=300641 RepID=A0AAV2TL44_CALDB